MTTSPPIQTPSSLRRHYGFRPSLPDWRDEVADTRELKILDEVDPRLEMQAPYDQLQLGSCDPNSWVGAAEYNSILNGKDPGILSRLFVYYLGRIMEGTLSYDSGLQGRTGGKILRKYGAPVEELWPYIIQYFATKPTEAAYAAAAANKIEKYVHPGLGMTEEHRIEALKAVLSNKQTVPFGWTVYDGFESEGMANSGKLWLPKTGEKVVGGHETVLVGYLKDEPEYGLVRNSWGTEWGLGGYFLMPWKYIANEKYASEWRSIYRPKGK